MDKRTSCRGVILDGDEILLMRRIKDDSEYYTYPGGGLEDKETKEECVKREILEELGIIVDVIKLLYICTFSKGEQYFYLCKYNSGTLGTGSGPEMINPKPGSGQHIPIRMEFDRIKDIPLMPEIITKQVIEDTKRYGVEFDNKIKLINDENW